MDRTLIDDFEGGGARLKEAVAGLTAEEMVKPAQPGDWTILGLVIHMADSDAIAIDRMKRIITEDNPSLLYADETAYVDRLCCHHQSCEDALALFAINRRQFARVLRRLDDGVFQRAGTHDKVGRVTLAELVRTYVDHLEHHLAILREKRSGLGV